MKRRSATLGKLLRGLRARKLMGLPRKLLGSPSKGSLRGYRSGYRYGYRFRYGRPVRGGIEGHYQGYFGSIRRLVGLNSPSRAPLREVRVPLKESARPAGWM